LSKKYLKMLNIKSIKTQVILFLVIFSLGLSLPDKNVSFLFSAGICLVCSILFELFFLVIKKKPLIFPESAVITGLILGLVLASNQPKYVYVLAAFLAIGSKQIIRIKEKHIFNPAAFGILLTTLLLHANTQWLGTYLWYVLAPVGLYFIYKLRKLELLISYLVTATLLWTIQSLIQKINPLYVFGYLSYFFIFIMLIEPKTTPITKLGKIIFGILVGVTIFILTQIGIRFDAELASLLLANTMVVFLNNLKTKKKEV